MPTPYCIGPWSPATQHGGPPAALLGGAAEAHGADAADFAVVRELGEVGRCLQALVIRAR